MRLPKDRVFCSNLQTAFTDYDGLLRYLAEEHFDGYIALQGGGRPCWLFIAGGDVTGGRDGDASGKAGAEGFRSRAQQAGRSMTVYRASSAQMRLLGAGGEAEPVYPPLPSEFVDVARMMDTLSRGEHTGYVELALRDGETVGYILLEDGAPVDAILSHSGETEAGLPLVPAMLAAVEASRADITVFRQSTPGESHDAGSKDGDDDTLNPRDADEVAATWSAILGAVGEVVDEVAEPGSFEAGLREALSEHTITYPYLDGGRGRLTYQEGAVRFVAPPPATVSRVLGECLSDAVARISFRSRKVDLEARIQQRLEGIVESHGESIRRHGIARAASPFLAA